MLLVAQFPFADLRPFLGSVPQRLASPFWASLNPNREYVRSFGHIRRRPWTEETPNESPFYCDARQALKLPSLEKAVFGQEPNRFEPRCAFRRLLRETLTGGAVEYAAAYKPIGWVEAGFSNVRPLVMSGEEAIAVVMGLMDLPCEVLRSHPVPVANPNGLTTARERAKGPLVRLGGHIARLYLHESTAQPSKSQSYPPDNVVKSGEPLFILECTEGELSCMPKHVTNVGSTETKDYRLGFVRLRYHNSEFGLWIITKGNFSLEARRLRLSILQMHAQQQALRQVLQQLAANKIPFTPRTLEGDELQAYLNDVTRLLNHARNEGNGNRELVEIISAYEALVDSAQFIALKAQLQGARRQILAKVEAFVSNQKLIAKSQVYAMAGSEVVLTNNFVGQGGTVNSTTVNIGDGNTFSGDFVVGSTLKNSMNKIMKSSVEEKTQVALKELHDKVRQLCEKLNASDVPAASGVARDLDSFVNEATAPKPRTNKLQEIGKDLIDAAKSVAEFATPVLTTVSAVLKLFGVPVP